MAEDKQKNGCSEEAGYLPDMPTNPQQLLTYICKTGIGPGPAGEDTSSLTNDMGRGIDDLTSATYLLPAQQAALFEVMADFNGFTIVRNAPDAIGRIGVAIRWSFMGAPAEIILNPVTYAYMGDRTWPEPGFKGPGLGRYDGAALVKTASVNKAGQLP